MVPPCWEPLTKFLSSIRLKVPKIYLQLPDTQCLNALFLFKRHAYLLKFKPLDIKIINQLEKFHIENSKQYRIRVGACAIQKQTLTKEFNE